MKLIDKTALIKEINKRLSEPAYQHENEDWYNGIIDAIDIIDEQEVIVETFDS